MEGLCAHFPGDLVNVHNGQLLGLAKLAGALGSPAASGWSQVLKKRRSNLKEKISAGQESENRTLPLLVYKKYDFCFTCI